MLRKIVSGGQTGVDRAALDSARLQTAFSWGGWCPKGRVAEDGQLGEEYFSSTRLGCGLKEATSSRPAQRTRLNVRDSDATLIVRSGRILSPGTKLTIKLLREAEKPYRICDPYKVYTVPRIVQWICEPQADNTIEILNVAGPRESKSKGIYDRTFQYLTDIFHLVALYQHHGIEIWNPKRNKGTESR